MIEIIMNGKPIIEINENQHRGISVSLGLLDQALCEIKQWAEGREIISIMYREQNQLSLKQRTGILGLIKDIQSIISEIRDAMQLKDHVIQATRSICGHCSILWEQILELESRRLSRYGEVSSSLVDYLDPKVEIIVKGILDISDLAKR